jgi:hypothetical protein
VRQSRRSTDRQFFWLVASGANQRWGACVSTRILPNVYSGFTRASRCTEERIFCWNEDMLPSSRQGRWSSRPARGFARCLISSQYDPSTYSVIRTAKNNKGMKSVRQVKVRHHMRFLWWARCFPVADTHIHAL